MMDKDLKIKGNISRVRSGYGGSQSKDYECDAVVMCNGWQTSNMLKRQAAHCLKEPKWLRKIVIIIMTHNDNANGVLIQKHILIILMMALCFESQKA